MQLRAEMPFEPSAFQSAIRYYIWKQLHGCDSRIKFIKRRTSSSAPTAVCSTTHAVGRCDACSALPRLPPSG